MVDIDAAIGYVVAKGDVVDRARLAHLRSGIAPSADVLAKVEGGQTAEGGWPSFWAGDVASIDATCFRLAELDDLGALARPAAVRALDFLAHRQRPDGMWEEDANLARHAPPWARPGDPEARLYLTSNASFWLAVAGDESGNADRYAETLSRASTAFRAAVRPDGTWPSFLVTGWLGAAMLHKCKWFYEAAQMEVVLAGRVNDMSAADLAWMIAALRRVGVGVDDWLVSSARNRLASMQRFDGAWVSDDGEAFDIHTILTALRGLL
jgi:hypothetical protein